VAVASFVASILPEPAEEDYRFLAGHDYEIGPGFKAAILRRDRLRIGALPRGSVF
jgi:nicotinate phosphoribosyltransferase